MMTRQNREVAVILSAEEYERIRQRNTEEFERFCDRVGAQAVARGLTGKKLAEILKS